MTDFLSKLSSPTDWPETWKDLQTIDSLLRCSICGEFFHNTTFIPDCSHNYCSLCIRRYLNVDSKCPSCGVSAQDTQLKNNRILDEIVKSFLKIRNELLQVIKNSGTDVNDAENKKLQDSKGGTKKEDNYRSKFFSLKSSKNKPVPSRSSKTSQKRRRKISSSSSDKSTSKSRSSSVDRKKLKRSNFNANDDTTDTDEISFVENPTPKKSPATSSLVIGRNEKNEGNEEVCLVDCPVCGKKMAQKKINLHLDSCLTSKEKKDNLRSSPMKQDQKVSEGSVGANSHIPQVAKRKPLNKLVYKLLSNADLKRKMKERGLSIKGDRQTLVKRHQEFTIMYNSECSKPRPKTVPEIVRLVEEGERKKNKPVENRDKLNFDRGQSQQDIDKMKDEYISQNQNQFTRLINEIKSRKTKDGKSSDNKNSKSRCSKSEDSPSTSKHQSLASKLLASDDDTASNSSGTDFEEVQKRYNTPRRQLRLSARTERRETRSSARKLEENVEDDASDVTLDTTTDVAETQVHKNPVDPMESSITSTTLPDPPSPSLLDDIDEKSSAESSESESMLRPAFGPSSSTVNRIADSPTQETPDDYESDEIEF